MAAPPTDEHPRTLLASPIVELTRWVSRAPVVALALGGIFAVAGVILALGCLEHRASRLDLLNPTSAFHRRWLAYLDEFGNQDDVVVVIEGARREDVVAARDELTAALDKESAFTAVLGKTDLSVLQAKALHYLTPDQLRALHQLLDQCDPLLRGDWSRLAIRDVLCGTPVATAGAQPNDHAEQLLRALNGDPVTPSAMAELLGPLRTLDQQLTADHLLLDEGRLGLVLLHLAPSTTSPKGADPLRRLRDLVEQTSRRHPNVRLGVTGVPVLEHDEMEASSRDARRASLWSLAGVTCVFAAGFGGFRRPLLAVVTLLLGIAWSLGYLTLSVGHVNILSAAFGVILLGLGIDFGIHYLACFGQLRDQGLDPRSALLNTARTVGPGIVTGGVTTALAFFATGLTDFTGIAELGVIAGGGVLLCALAALLMLPPLLLLSERSAMSRLRERVLPLAVLAIPAVRWPRMTLAFALAATLAAGWGVTRLRYDHNLLHLQPLDQECVVVEKKLAALSDRGTWYAVSLCRNHQELLERKQRFTSVPFVTISEEIASLVPQPTPERENLIARLHERLRGLPSQPPLIPVAEQQLLLQQLEDALTAQPALASHLRPVLQRLRGLSPHDYFERVSRWQQANARHVLDNLLQLRAMSNPVPPAIADLPAALKQRFIGRTGQHLLRIYGEHEIWNMEALTEFVRGLEAVDPQITGHPVQAFYASRQMQEAYVKAAVYAFLAVVMVLVIDFRSLRCVLWAMLPMLLGFLQTLGLLGWLGIPLNPANMIVLPLILGIGVDDGVHVVHDALRQRQRFSLSDSTAAAITLTSVTTMIGFGSLVISDHLGLQSLGQVLTLGVFSCLFSSLLILPALLSCRSLSNA